jgi:DNA-binding protein Fis
MFTALMKEDNLHPEANTVALLLAAERAQITRPTLEEAAHTVLARYFEDWVEEQKADLYALLAEKVTANMTISQMVRAVSRCMWDNQNHWAARHG